MTGPPDNAEPHVAIRRRRVREEIRSAGTATDFSDRAQKATRRDAQGAGIDLRPYQAEAVAAIVAAHRAGENPVVSLPTGSGKSIVIAAIVEGLSPNGDERIVITVPSRELCEQNERALHLVLPADQIGVVCASLGRREFDRRILIGTPQSLAGAIDYSPACIIVDEAHQMPLHRGSWFARLFDALPAGRATPRVGLTATSFRTADGAIFGGRGSWFTAQPYEKTFAELVAQGWLAPVRSVAPSVLMTTRGVARVAGDFNQGQLARVNLRGVGGRVRVVLDEMQKRRLGAGVRGERR